MQRRGSTVVAFDRAWLSGKLSGTWAKPVVFLLALLPLAWLVWGIAVNRLGANPAETLIRSLGDWTLRMLCVVLAVTPVRTMLGLAVLARFRRMLGLFVYFYACPICYHAVAYKTKAAARKAWNDLNKKGENKKEGK